MRLIDADVLEKEFDELRRCRDWYGADFDVLDIVKEELIDNQPTAYDVKKVVEQLENNLLHSEDARAEATIGMCGVSANIHYGEVSAYTNAINIVKGGVNE